MSWMDLEGLLAPISGASATGEPLRYDALYDTLKELRREDDPTLPQGVWKHELKRADWSQIESLAGEAIARRSKDLQLAGWLAEAWTHLYGFGGARQGLELLAELVRRFWDDVHPVAGNGDIEVRLAPLRWINDQLAKTLRLVPLTRPDAEEAPVCTWGDWEDSLYLSRLAATDREGAARAEAAGRITQPRFFLSVNLTSGSHFLRLSEQVAGVEAAIGNLDAVLTERCGRGMVSLAALGETTAAIGAFLGRILSERVDAGELAPSLMEEPSGEGGSPWAAELSAHAPAPGRITSRAEAYQRLTEAAEYLLRTEPHSPAPYLVRRAVLWGNLSLAELLAELLAGKADLATIYALLGIKRMDVS